ncbi:Rossmann-like domain-containing protein [Methanocaldococcus fervens]|uniref:Putative heavy-metal chelation domain-containing protein n=1 Tax=Methanocaldococcus fervens (strain DSM 4213 / JCM 15782 / AG86) TaxID=573064 RepID=C7P6P7_METFA|nr:DUF364 domain-containing protein [Methanocaldococcus fervens]ACV24229.1 protein of unknown function DUF364 [Methanocaldococcus fervens AG86]
MKDLILKTAKDVNELVSGNIEDIIVSNYHPWVTSYVKYDDEDIGCGVCAAVYKGMGEEKIPLNLFKEINNLDIFGKDAYSIINEFIKKEELLYNSIAISTLSALSYKLLSKDFLEKDGYVVNEISKIKHNLFGELIGEEGKKIVDKDDIVAIVGFAHWTFPYLKDKIKELRCLELLDKEYFDVFSLKREKPKINVYNDPKEVLKEADVVFITGMTILNGTLKNILKNCKNARFKIIYGSSCSFYPKYLFNLGIDCILAMKIPNDYETKINIIETRGYYPFLSPNTKMLMIMKR